jgi:hypothetical protein
MIILLRKPDKSDYSNPLVYRPIALLNTLEKTLKAIVARRIRYVVKAYGLFSKTQIGVRRERLTETALYLLTEKVYII